MGREASQRPRGFYPRPCRAFTIHQTIFSKVIGCIPCVVRVFVVCDLVAVKLFYNDFVICGINGQYSPLVYSEGF